MKLAIILGTRPEIIKMAPVIRACEKLDVPFFILHTGQHYSPNMDKIFFEELELPQPRYNIETGGKPYRQQVGIMVRDIQNILASEEANIAIVQGDTNSVLAGALAANKLGIKVAHHEAGLRSHDLTMPEEKNRIITDHISDYLFTPTRDAHRNIIEEGIPHSKIFFTGNTIVDAVLQNKELAKKRAGIIGALGLKDKNYLLVTAHRAENVDEPERLRGIIGGLKLVKEALPQYKIAFSLHPRTASRLQEFGIEKPNNITFFEPVGFLEFLALESEAALIITDSGGIQEEASILHVPCVTIRDNTERPETIDAGMNVLAGTHPQKILACVEKMLAKDIRWEPVFGDGTAGEKIIQILAKQ